ncbi:MAG: hemerythrin domain-containing protein [Bacteroidota bacterium]|nr:hemerythrin domain-containing protein [Kiloniellaceae bacterium]
MSARHSIPPQIEPPALALLNDPIDFFFAEHFRQRTVCNLLELLAAAESLDQAMAGEVLSFLKHDLSLHVQDEEEDLFPLLRRRCLPEDAIERVLAALTAEHAADRLLAETMVSGLQHALRGKASVVSRTRLRAAMRDFARNERRHLALENAVMLPLARRRLTDRDLTMLTVRMWWRRRPVALG